MATQTIPHGRLWAEDLAELKKIQRPVILVPTPAQLGRGQRVVDALDDQLPASALARRALAAEHGWAVRAAYSHALMPPKRGGEDWWEQHTVTLRVEHAERRLRGWGAWVNGHWDGGQFGRVVGDGTLVDALSLVSVGSEAFGWMLQWDTPPAPALTTCALCREIVPAKKDGNPRVHQWLGSKCPGKVKL